MTPGTTNANVGHRSPAKMYMRINSHMFSERRLAFSTVAKLTHRM